PLLSSFFPYTTLFRSFVLMATVGFLVWLNWKLFVVSLVVVPLQVYGVRKVRSVMVDQTREVRELNAEISSFLVEALSAIKFIKLDRKSTRLNSSHVSI